MITYKNVFEALDTRKKKKSSKSKDGHDKKKKLGTKEAAPEPEPPKLPAIPSKPLNSNWADSEEEDDFANDLGPLPESWAVCSVSPWPVGIHTHVLQYMV